MAKTVKLRVIAPGWGSSGFYPAEVLQRDAGVIKAGTKMFIDHPTLEEDRQRPERSVRDLVGELIEDAKWERDGLYARAKVFRPFSEVLPEIHGSIGVSIRGTGVARKGEADGKRGAIIERITGIQSVDFVTTPGAGGRVVELMESAKEDAGMDKSEVVARVKRLIDERNAAIAEAKRLADENARLENELAQHKVEERKRQTMDRIREAVGKHQLPGPIAARVAASISIDKAGDADDATLAEMVRTAVTAEQQYLREAAPGPVIRHNGNAPTGDDLKQRAFEAFRRMGLTEAAAERAARGR